MTQKPHSNAAMRTAMESARKYLIENRAEARYTDSFARAKVEEGLKVRVEGPGGESLVTDMPAGVGGGGEAPSPGWYWRAAVAACVTSLAVMRAAQLEIDGFACEVEVDSESDDYGILDLDPSVPAGPISMRISIQVSAKAAGTAQLTELANWAVNHCPVSEAIRRAIPTVVEVNS